MFANFFSHDFIEYLAIKFCREYSEVENVITSFDVPSLQSVKSIRKRVSNKTRKILKSPILTSVSADSSGSEKSDDEKHTCNRFPRGKTVTCGKNANNCVKENDGLNHSVKNFDLIQDLVIHLTAPPTNKITIEYKPVSFRKARDGDFFPYYHNLSKIDLSEFGVFKQGDDLSSKNCLILAFEQVGVSKDKIELVKEFVIKGNDEHEFIGNNSIGVKHFQRISEIIEHDIKIKYPASRTKTFKCGLEGVREIEIGYLCNHFFLNREIPCNIFVIKNYFKLMAWLDTKGKKANTNFELYYNYDKNVGRYKKRKARTTSFLAIKYLVNHKDTHLSKISMDDKLQGVSKNSETEDIKPTKRRKAFYIWVCLKKKLLYTSSRLRGMRVKEVQEIAGTYTADDEIEYDKELIVNSKFNMLKNVELAVELRKRGLPYSRLSKDGKILALTTTTAKIEPDLDTDQREILKSEYRYVLVHAGPGAGKTTTLAALVAQEKDKRRLFLVYTRSTKTDIIHKLNKRSVRVDYKKYVKNVQSGQVFVLTMDEYAAQRQCSFNMDDTYRTVFQKSIKKGLQNWEKWDLLIIDELQDIIPRYERLVEQLIPVSKRCIFAGDPRQELYPGATFMTKLWRGDKFKNYMLRYNHRSLPEIVELLNLFSKTHFGDLHVEQIPTRTGKAIIKCEKLGSYTAIAKRASELSVEAPNYDAYCIAPVTVRKYLGTDEIVTGIRQYVVNMGGPYVKVLADGCRFDPKEPIIYIGTAYMLKGTEKNTVTLIQSDIPYHRINIKRSALTRLMYVSLSRARDVLTVLITQDIGSNNVLACLAPKLKMTVEKEREEDNDRLPKVITVTDDIDDCPVISVNVDNQVELYPIPYRSIEAPDVLGLLIEGHLAKYLGLPSPTKIRCKIDKKYEYIHTYIKNDTLVIKLPRKLGWSIGRLSGENEFILAKVRYTIRAGTLWTISDTFKDEKFEDLSPFVQYLEKLKCPKICENIRSHNVTIKITAHRAPFMKEPLGYLRGVTDIELDNNIIEVKHANDNTKHRRQVIAYTLMSENTKNAILVNTKNGKIQHLTTSMPKPKFSILVRAILAAKQAQTAKIKIVKPLPIDGWPDMVVVVDIEHTMFSKCIFEIGAVAFSRGESKILDVYHALSEGVTENIKIKDPKKLSWFPDGAGPMCGVEINEEKVEKYHDHMITQFKNWIRNLEDHILLQWAGNDAQLLGLKSNDNCRDLYKLYKVWLEQNNQTRKGDLKLIDAVNHVLGPNFLFAQHRAYEDAVATMAIFISIT